MKTYSYYSTFATALITTCRGNVYERYFYECHELEWFKDWAQMALEEDGIEIASKMISQILFIDSKTGELLLECARNVSGPTEVKTKNDPWDYVDYDEDEEDIDSDDDWGYNEDMGYDPYLGCYTDDC